MSNIQQEDTKSTVAAGEGAAAAAYMSRLLSMALQVANFSNTNRPWRVYDLSHPINNPELMSLCQLQRLHPRESLMVHPIKWKNIHLDILRCVFYPDDSPLPAFAPDYAITNKAMSCACHLQALLSPVSTRRDKMAAVTALFTGLTDSSSSEVGFTSDLHLAYDHVHSPLPLAFASTMGMLTIPNGGYKAVSDGELPHACVLGHLAKGTHTHLANLAYVDLGSVMAKRRQWRLKHIARTWADQARDPFIVATIIGLAQRADRESGRLPVREANGRVYEDLHDARTWSLASIMLAEGKGDEKSDREVAQALLQARFVCLLYQVARARGLTVVPGPAGGFLPQVREPTTEAEVMAGVVNCARYVVAGGHVGEDMLRGLDALKAVMRLGRAGPVGRYRCVCLASSPTDGDNFLVYSAAVSTAFLDRLEKPHEPPRVDVQSGLEIRVDLFPLRPLETLPSRLEVLLRLLGSPVDAESV
ncbi:hypothetical protein MCOR27_001165 [Pyricularia oryzae]|uniref:Uncharacterized protein n=1 Tax=Pyricularia grisea TaxID=148305 RepID=A0ABQ8NZU5_PYRGI|nr:hypothetical protein MCOR02_006914 [Pyricularia oryzae]KAI6304495.1 hypothetical protein MCOR33_000587 [Pyricularia grisea]KAI6253115.1 hypothetical protein MCOR19_010312 [Pyricularia oryzae]KAI6270373.1 hypothetical protein MCOR26_008261 [Pyricularia oryzae]KAI6287798.1 hypothetical protein MCOR27_001165 [Pyricularia oryzae]